MAKKEKVYQYEDWTYQLNKYYKNDKYELRFPKNNYHVATLNGEIIGEYNNVEAEGYVIVT